MILNSKILFWLPVIFIYTNANPHITTQIDNEEYKKQMHQRNIKSKLAGNGKAHAQDVKIDALKEKIRRLTSHHNYKSAAEAYVQLWHITENFSDLTKAVDLYMSCSKYRELQILMNNIIELKGVDFHNYELVLLLAQAYYQQGVEAHDMTALKKAMEYMKAYEEHAQLSAAYREYITNAREDIVNIFAINDLRALLYAAMHEKQTSIWIMRECIAFMKKYPKTQYNAEVKKLYMEIYEIMRLKQLTHQANWIQK